MTRAEITEALLLAAALRACRERKLMLTVSGTVAEAYGVGVTFTREAPTLTDALTALLDDLGEPGIEWPSEAQVARAYQVYEHEDLRDLFAREPLTVLALLAGDS